MSFLVFGSTAYLKDNCFVKIALSKLGLQTGFAFITALNQVCTELIRIRFRLDIESHVLTIEEALVKTKGTESPPSDKRKPAIRNQQTAIEGIPVVPR